MFKSLLLSVIVVALLPSVSAAEASVPGVGHWEGNIVIPGTPLAIRVDLEQKDGAWSGTIDIPAQGLRGFRLAKVSVTAFDVSFAMEGIPGDPMFKGKLKGADMGIAGDFTQGGQTFPFQLERKAAQQLKAGDTPQKGLPGSGLAGFWQGSLKPTVVAEMRLALEIVKASDEVYKGVAISLDQGAAKMPLTAVTEKAGVVHLEIASVGGEFDGKMSADGSEIAGEWRQSGSKLPLVYKRMSSPAKKTQRPQEPKKPLPYSVEGVVVPNEAANIKLAGTLTLPKTGGPHPAVVLITGSGPQDRDEALMGHRPFLVLADHLTRQGIAVLRCDDRGVGKSTGNFAAATDTDFVEDTLSSVEWLKQRKDIDPKRIGLIGHSEGGVVGPLVAAKQPQDIAFIVMLAGPGVPMERLLVKQAEDMARVSGMGNEGVATLVAMQSQTLALLKTAATQKEAEVMVSNAYAQQIGEISDEALKAMGLSRQMPAAQLKTTSSNWFRQLLAYDPAPTLMKLKCPVLAINGEKDVQVAAKENLAAIREALSKGSNADATIIELPKLNHLFQSCTTGAVAEYSEIEETFSPAALKVVSDWVQKKAKL